MEEEFINKKYQEYLKGLFNKYDKPLTKYNLDELYFINGLAPVQDASGKWGFINQFGEEIIPCAYKDVKPMSEGMIGVQNDKYRWGFIDLSGNVVIPYQYIDVKKFKEGMAGVLDCKSKWGFINKQGKLVIKNKFVGINSFHDGKAIAYPENDRIILIDKVGQQLKVIPTHGIFIESRDFEEELAAMSDSNYGTDAWGFIDNNAERVIPCRYPMAEDFSDGLSCVQSHDNFKNMHLYGFINKTGKEVIPCQYTGAKSYSEGLIPVRNVKLNWGFINSSSKKIIPFNYKDAGIFSNGLASVCNKNDQWGYIDNLGNVIIPFSYKQAEDFKDGIAPVQDMNGNWKLINKKNEEQIGKHLQDNLLLKANVNYTKSLLGYSFTDEYSSTLIKTKYLPLYNYKNFIILTNNNDLYIYDKSNQNYNLINSSYNPSKSLIATNNYLKLNDKEYIIYDNSIIDISGMNMNPAEQCLFLKDPNTKVLNLSEFTSELKKDENFYKKLILNQEKTSIEALDNAVKDSQLEKELGAKKAELATKKITEGLELFESLPTSNQSKFKIPSSLLFLVMDDGHKVIKNEFKDRLKYIDLSNINFSNVDIRGIDFTGCNIIYLDPQTVYNKDLSNTTFGGEYSPFGLTSDFNGVNTNNMNIGTMRDIVTRDYLNAEISKSPDKTNTR